MASATHQSPLKRILVNVGFITGSNLSGRLLNLLLHAALGRLFGAEALGGYSTAVAVAAYFVFAVDFGLAPRIVREGAVAPERLDREYADALGLKLVTGVLAVAGLVVLCQLLPYSPEVIELVFFFSLASVVNAFSYLNESVCRAKERLDLEGASKLLHAVVFVGSTLLCYAADLPVGVVGYTSVGAALFQLAFSTVLARRFVALRIHLPPQFGTARQAMPYATTSLMLLAFAQIDVLILSMIESQEFVGRYASISRLLAIAGTLGALASAGVLPTASRVYATAEPDRFAEVVNQIFRCMLLIGGGAAVGLLALARPAIQIVYGPDFASLYPYLQMGSLFLVFKFPVSGLAIMLTSSGRQSLRARAIVIGLIATVVLVLLLVPRLGIEGAVIAMVASEAVLLGCFTWYMSDSLDARAMLRTAASLALAIPLAAAVHFRLEGDGDLASVAASTLAPLLVYAAGITLTGEAKRTLRFLQGVHRSQSVAARPAEAPR